MTASARDAYRALTEDRHFKYRPCAPDVDEPHLSASGHMTDPHSGDNVRLPVDAWAAPDLDGGEDQTARRTREDAAIDACVECPVMVLCLQYANSQLPDGRIAEPWGIFGGQRALERHKGFIRRRHEEDADKRMRTPQKQAVLAALLLHDDPELVAAAAGMDLRTANWQRSAMATLLRLDKATATRADILAAANARGLLPTPQPAPAQADVDDPAPHPQPAPVRPVRIPAPDRRRYAHIPGQLTLDTALADARPRRLHLVPTGPAPVLEAAA